MTRGDIWTVSAATDYVGKPRPAVIIQNDRFSDTSSVTICAFTSSTVEAPLARLPIQPSSMNGLLMTSRLMVDKIETIPKNKLGKRIGQLDRADIDRLDRAILTFLDLGSLFIEKDAGAS